MPHFAARVIKSFGTIHNEIGAFALFGIGHLAGEDRFELFRRHAGARQSAGALDSGRGGDDHDDIDFLLAMRLEQQGNVEEDDPRIRGAMPVEEIRLCATHQGMNDRFKLGKAVRGAREDLRQGFSINRIIDNGLRKGLSDRCNRGTVFCIERMNRFIGIEDRHTQFGKHARGFSLAHGDRTGETDHLHVAR